MLSWLEGNVEGKGMMYHRVGRAPAPGRLPATRGRPPGYPANNPFPDRIQEGSRIHQNIPLGGY